MVDMIIPIIEIEKTSQGSSLNKIIPTKTNGVLGMRKKPLIIDIKIYTNKTWELNL